MRAPLLALPFLFFAKAGFAVSLDDETPPKPTETTTTCTEGQIWDEEAQKCVESDQQYFNDDDRYNAVRELAYSRAYDRALAVIASADAPDDPRFLNYRGFIARKTGPMEDAVGYYQAALAERPDYILARSYLGMGFVDAGKSEAARAELRAIEAYGGKDTWAYDALAKALFYGTSSSY